MSDPMYNTDLKKLMWCGTPMIEDEEKPTAIFFSCKNGSVRTATMEQGFEPCEGCDCGWADIVEAAKDAL